jgi:hypothetical protein
MQERILKARMLREARRLQDMSVREPEHAKRVSVPTNRYEPEEVKVKKTSKKPTVLAKAKSFLSPKGGKHQDKRDKGGAGSGTGIFAVADIGVMTQQETPTFVPKPNQTELGHRRGGPLQGVEGTTPRVAGRPPVARPHDCGVHQRREHRPATHRYQCGGKRSDTAGAGMAPRGAEVATHRAERGQVYLNPAHTTSGPIYLDTNILAEVTSGGR